MTTTEQPLPELDRRLAAHDARSILACPAAADLRVEGEEHPLDGAELGLADHRGTPVLRCPAGSPLSRAADDGRGALLTVASGLGPLGGPERADTLTVSGRLERTGFERGCCGQLRHVVSLRSTFVLLSRPDQHQRVPVEDLASPEHHLSRGHLQRLVEHAHGCRHEELRRAVALGTGTHPGDLAGVRIAHLSPTEATLQWVDVAGAHQRTVRLPRRARDLVELGELLRRRLHAGIC